MEHPAFSRQRIPRDRPGWKPRAAWFLTSEIRGREISPGGSRGGVPGHPRPPCEGHPLSRDLGQIELPAIAGRLKADFGVGVMAPGRMARATEEAWYQDAAWAKRGGACSDPSATKASVRNRAGSRTRAGRCPWGSRKAREGLTTPRAVLAEDRCCEENTTSRPILAVPCCILNRWQLAFRRTVVCRTGPWRRSRKRPASGAGWSFGPGDLVAGAQGSFWPGAESFPVPAEPAARLHPLFLGAVLPGVNRPCLPHLPPDRALARWRAPGCQAQNLRERVFATAFSSGRSSPSMASQAPTR